jgi:hypothetical protein
MTPEEIGTESLSIDLGESFYGDESFDLDELDKEGFEGLDTFTTDLGENDLH